MALPAGDCDAGYYCPGGAVSRREVMCPVGHYCEEGSAQPTPCPSGTMSNELGNPNITYCELCTAGYYCSGTNNTNVTGENYILPHHHLSSLLKLLKLSVFTGTVENGNANPTIQLYGLGYYGCLIFRCV